MAVALLLASAGFAVACGGESPGSTGTAESPWLRDVTTELGIDFLQEPGATGAKLLIEITAGGVALFDADGDGDLDAYLVQGNRNLPEGAPADDPTNRFFRQEASGHFTDATAASGLGDGGYGLGAAVGDVDNDGDLDVYVTNLGADRLYRNRGDGRFEDATAAAGITANGFSSSAGFFDGDNDGDLDLYVARYVVLDPNKTCYGSTGRADYCGPKSYVPIHDILLRNEGDGTFTDVSEQAGLTRVAAAGLGVAFSDVDEDGLMDVYVANDGYANNLWVNKGDWSFRDEALSLGVAYNEIGSAEAGMGVFFADLDEDGLLDIFLTHLRSETNTYYRSLGPGRGYADASTASGLAAPSLQLTGFGTAAVDMELDGDLDLLVVNGSVRTDQRLFPNSLPEPWNDLPEPNGCFVNEGQGRFAASAACAGELGEVLKISRGLAVGDIDGDGDLDALVGNVAGPARLYLNEAPRRGHWLAVRAFEPKHSRDALNARVTVSCGGRKILRTVSPASSYLSSSEPVAHFGLGDCEAVESITVRWPDGTEEQHPGGPVDRRLTLSRDAGEPAP